MASSGNILAQLQHLQTAGSAYADSRPGAREQLMKLSYALISSLELPSEAIQRQYWAEPARAAHSRIAVELKLFEHLKEIGDAGISCGDLAAKAGADAVLISRILKHLAAMNMVGEKEPDIYLPTPLSNAFTEPRFRDGIIYGYDVALPCFRVLPDFLKDTNYALPTVPVQSPFQKAHKTNLFFWAWLDQHPPYLDTFNSYMAGHRAGRPAWLDPGFYPVAERLGGLFDPTSVGGGSDVLLVDVGGGLGHDLKELKAKYPALPGRLVLQDRAEVISSLPGGGGGGGGDGVFEAATHDFFTPQPVEGARAYYLHSVLHDWQDNDCVKILEQLKPAMKKGYSTVLLNEIVVPDRDAPWPVTCMDQLLMVLGAMKERTEEQWRVIIERAGFKIQKIYSFEMGLESLIELELV